MSKIRRMKKNLLEEVNKGHFQLTPQRVEIEQKMHPSFGPNSLSTQEFRSQCNTRIAQALVTKLGIKTGEVTFANPRVIITETETKYAVEMYITSDKPNSGLIIYRGPFDELYDASLMLALLEVEQTP